MSFNLSAVQTVLHKTGMLKPKPFVKRRHKRYPCCIVGTLQLLERGLTLEGSVMELSQGGAIFRPASYYIFERTGEEGLLVFENIKILGKIKSTRQAGYGMALYDLIDEETVMQLAKTFGYDKRLSVL